MTKMLTDLAFDFFYVMNEGKDEDSDGWRRKTATLLMLVELGQMLRSITLKQFGWCQSAANAMAYSDPVWIFTDMAQRVLPRSLFFYVALLLVISLFTVTGYAVRVLKRGTTVSKFHVHTWRWLYFVSSEILFTSVIQWIMFPVECFVYEDMEGSMSETDDGCAPWDSPQSAASVVSLILVAIHIIFTLVAMLLSFEIHPLSRNPWAQCTGRVEALWALFKVVIVMCAYLNRHVSSIVLSGAALVFASTTLYAHTTILPFHDHMSNVVRSGALASLWWLSLGCVVAACYPPDGQAHQTRQSALLAVSPLFFVAGIIATLRKKAQMLKYLHMLRGELAAVQQPGPQPALLKRRESQDSIMMDDATVAGSLASKKAFRQQRRRLSLADDCARSVASFTTSRCEAPKSSTEKFFDPHDELSRAFKSGVTAWAYARRLLAERDIDDVGFLSLVVLRGLKENPEAPDLLVFQLQLFRFIIGDAKTADSELVRMQSQGMVFDHQFLLYSVARRATNDALDATKTGPGGQTVNAKFDEHMGLAKRATADCIGHMAAFWKLVRRLKKTDNGSPDLPMQVAEDLLLALEAFETTYVTAEQEFGWLLDKAPTEGALLQQYAVFLDICANNEREAEKFRTQAAMLEKGGCAELGEGMDPETDGLGGRPGSVATSDTEKSRTVMTKWMGTWSSVVLGAELSGVHSLHRRVKLFVLLLVTVATVGMVVSDQLLFNSMVKEDINMIDKTGLFRAYTQTSCFLLRSQFIAAHSNDTATIEKTRNTLFKQANAIREGHVERFSRIHGYQRDDYTTPRYEVLVPRAGKTSFRREMMDYWTMGGDLARRLERLATMDEAEILRGGDSMHSLQGNRHTVFMFENAARALLPTMESIVAMYQDQVENFGRVTTALVSVTLVLNAVLCLGVACAVLWAVVDLVHVLQSRYVCCTLALSLPHDTVKKLYRFYVDSASGIRQMEDEEAEKRAIIGDGNDDDQDSNPDEGEEEDNGHLGAMIGHADDAASGIEPQPHHGALTVVHAHEVLRATSPQLVGIAGVRDVFLSSEVLQRHHLETSDEPDPQAPLRVWSETGEYHGGGSPGRSLHVSEYPPPPPMSGPRLPDTVHEELEQQEAEEVERDPTPPGSEHSLSVSEHHGDEDEGWGKNNVGRSKAQMRVKENGDEEEGTEEEEKEKEEQEEDGGGGAGEAAVGRVGERRKEGLRTADMLSWRKGEREAVGVGDGLQDNGGEEQEEGQGRPRMGMASEIVLVSASPLLQRCRQRQLDEATDSSSDDALPGAGAGAGAGGASVRVTGCNFGTDDAGEEARKSVDCTTTTAAVDMRGRSMAPRPTVDKGEEEGGAIGAGVGQLRGPERSEAPAERAGAGAGGAWRGALAGSEWEEKELVLEQLLAEREGRVASCSPPLLGGPRGMGGRTSSTGVLRAASTSPRSKPQDRQRRKITFDAPEHHKLSSDDVLPLALDSTSPDPKPERIVAQTGAQRQVEVEEEVLSAVGDSEAMRREREQSEGDAEDGGEGGGDGWKEVDSSAGGMTSQRIAAVRYTLQTVGQAQKRTVRKALAAVQGWSESKWVYVGMFALMFALCLFSTLYPARFVGRLVNLGPSTNAAGRRRYLTRACVHYARELVLDDGFSRMDKAALHGALAWHLAELQRVSRAVRLGDAELGIAVGADYRSSEHNAIMYSNRCPWREDSSDCSLPGLPEVQVDGLYSLLLHFYEAVSAVMATHGIEAAEAEAAYKAFLARDGEPPSLPPPRLDDSRVALLASDKHMKLILQSFDGDLFQGLGSIVGEFHEETEVALERVHLELQMLYAVYILVVLVVFYLLLFRQTLRAALAQVCKTRAFVSRMPCHVLDKRESDLVRLFFETSGSTLRLNSRSRCRQPCLGHGARATADV